MKLLCVHICRFQRNIVLCFPFEWETKCILFFFRIINFVSKLYKVCLKIISKHFLIQMRYNISIYKSTRVNKALKLVCSLHKLIVCVCYRFLLHRVLHFSNGSAWLSRDVTRQVYHTLVCQCLVSGL